MANEVFTVVKTMVTDLTTQANAIADDVQKSRVNVGKLTHEFRKAEDTPHAWIQDYQTWLEKAEAQIEAKTKAVDDRIKAELVQATGMTDEVFEAKKAEYKVLKKGADSARKLAADIPGYDESLFADIPAMLTLAGGTAGAATGTKRPRLASLVIDGQDCYVEKKADDGTVTRSYTFTNGAAVIAKDSKSKVSPSELSAAAFDAAKTDDLSTVTAVEFAFTPVGSDHKPYMIVATPAQSAE